MTKWHIIWLHLCLWHTLVAILLMSILSYWNYCQCNLNATHLLSRWDCNRIPRGYGNEAGQETRNQPCKSVGKYSHTHLHTHCAKPPQIQMGGHQSTKLSNLQFTSWRGKIQSSLGDTNIFALIFKICVAWTWRWVKCGRGTSVKTKLLTDLPILVKHNTWLGFPKREGCHRFIQARLIFFFSLLVFLRDS